jgi:chromosome segregation ATPase
MNDEEKVLSLLENMLAEISSIKEGQASLQKGQASIQTDISAIKKNQARLQEGQAKLFSAISYQKEDMSMLKEEWFLFNRRIISVERDLHDITNNLLEVHGIVKRVENGQGKKPQSNIGAKIVNDEIHKQHELRIIKMEAEVARLNSEIRAIEAVK